MTTVAAQPAAFSHPQDILYGLAAQAARVAEADRERAALLAAVGHDLRAPLAAAKAAVSGLRADDSRLTTDDRADLLAAAEESLDRLAHLVASLLDVSRLQAGSPWSSRCPPPPPRPAVPAGYGLRDESVSAPIGQWLKFDVALPGLLCRRHSSDQCRDRYPHFYKREPVR